MDVERENMQTVSVREACVEDGNRWNSMIQCAVLHKKKPSKAKKRRKT